MTYNIMLDHISEGASDFEVRFVVTADLGEWAERRIPSRADRYRLLAAEMRKAADYIEEQAGDITSPIGRPPIDQRYYP